MKRVLCLILISFALSACAPVLSRDVMRQALRDVPLWEVRQDPKGYEGKLFVLGGVIVETKLIEAGSQIEALFVPVNRQGYLRDSIDPRDGRFLAVYPRERGFLEPLIFKKGRQVTLAGAFTGTRTARLDNVEYTYPVFEIRQIHLWEEYRENYSYAPYSYPPYPYWWYDPWWRPYPYPYPYWPPPGR